MKNQLVHEAQFVYEAQFVHEAMWNAISPWQRLQGALFAVKRSVVRSVPLFAAWQPASVVLLRLFCVSPDAIFICDRNDFGFMNCSFIF